MHCHSMRLQKTRAKGMPEDIGEKVAMYVINTGGKMPTPWTSEEKVTPGVENRTEVVVANVEYEKYSTVKNEMKLELSSVEVELLRKMTFQALIEVALQNWYCLPQSML